VAKTNKKTKKQSVSKVLREGKYAAAFDALMRSLKHVKSSGPYTPDEMNER
jgi:hypothetical protein